MSNRRHKARFLAPVLIVGAFALSGCVNVESESMVDDTGKFTGTLTTSIDTSLIPGAAGITSEKLAEATRDADPDPSDAVTVKWAKSSDNKVEQTVSFTNATSEEINAAMESFKSPSLGGVSPSESASGAPGGMGMGETNLGGTTEFPWVATVENGALSISMDMGDATESLGSGMGFGDEKTTGGDPSAKPSFDANIDPEAAKQMSAAMAGMLGDSGFHYKLTTPGVIEQPTGAFMNMPGVKVDVQHNEIQVNMKLAELMSAASGMDPKDFEGETGALKFTASTDPNTVDESAIVAPDPSASESTAPAPAPVDIQTPTTSSTTNPLPFVLGGVALVVAGAVAGVLVARKGTKGQAGSTANGEGPMYDGETTQPDE